MSAPSYPARLLLALIRLYQFTFSTVMGKQCRFYPSCSHYTAEAIGKFGAAKGGWLGALRILRCHPWRAGGHDPVPDKFCYNPKTCDKTHHDYAKDDRTI